MRLIDGADAEEVMRRACVEMQRGASARIRASVTQLYSFV